MNLWRVTQTPGAVHFGSVTAVALNPAGCNQPFCGRFWCPRKGWFVDRPCPFRDRGECDTFRRMAGTV